MWLETIALEHFRNYKKLEMSFNEGDGVHLIIGDNAQGKTNFLEAILLMSMAKSFRKSRPAALGSEFWKYDAYISGFKEFINDSK